jgi:hypothetical protein
MVSLVQDKVAISLRLWPMNLQIHLRQRFLHMLNMLGSHLHQIGAVPHQGPYRNHIALRPECRSQQPD